MRAALRALGYVIAELVPAQAFRVALNKDYAQATADRDFYRHRAEFLADALVQAEEETEVWEPEDSPLVVPPAAGGVTSPPVEHSPWQVAPGGEAPTLEDRVAALESHIHWYMAPDTGGYKHETGKPNK
jgi:hypothetical protein